MTFAECFICSFERDCSRLKNNDSEIFICGGCKEPFGDLCDDASCMCLCGKTLHDDDDLGICRYCI